MTIGKALNGKPYAGNPHVRFDEGEVASAAMPRRGSLLYNIGKRIAAAAIAASAAIPLAAGTANAPISAVSDGVNITSAGSSAASASSVALETRYRTSELSNFIDMITDKIKGLFVIVK